MRLFALAAVLSLCATSALAADPIEGDWMVGSGTRVKIAPCAGKADRMCGVISWMKNPNDKLGQPLRDTENPDPKLRSRPIVGIAFIRDFKRAAPGRWSGGKIYDPGSGKTYDARVRLNSDDTLKVEGCVLVVCQAQTWRRPS